MAFDLNAFDTAYGTSGAPALNMSSAGLAPTATPKPGFAQFAGNVAKSAVSVAKSAGNAVLQPLEQAGRTVADIPSQAIHAATGTAKETGALLTGNKQAYNNEVAKQNAYRNSSYIGKEYGQGNVESLKHAAEFATTAATLGAPVLKPVAAAVEGASAATKVGTKLLNAGKEVVGAGKTVASNPIIAATGKAVRNVVLAQPTTQLAEDTAQNAANNNMPGLAGDAGLIAAGPAVSKIAPIIGSGLKALFRSDQGMSNMLKFKDGTIESVLSDLHNKAVAGDTQAANDYVAMKNQAKVAIDHMNAEGRTPGQIAQYQTNHGNPTESMNVKDFLQQNADLASATSKFQQQAKNGELVLNGDGNKAVPADMHELVGAGKFDQSVKADLIRRLSAADPAERGAILQQDVQNGLDYTRNPNVFRSVQTAAIHSDPAEMAKAINDITGTSRLKAAESSGSATLDKLNGSAHTAKDKTSGGYIPIIRPKGAVSFNHPDQIDNAILDNKRGKLAPLTDATRKAGASLAPTDSAATKVILKQNFAEQLQSKGVQGDPKIIMKALDAASNSALGAFDPRSLTKQQIANALKDVAPQADAGSVRSAYIKAMATLPKEQVGLGQSVLNKTIGQSPLFNKYMRAQAIGRYELNPIFWVKQNIKGAMIAAVEGARLGTATSADDALALKESGLLSDSAKGGGDVSSADALGGQGGGKLLSPTQQSIIKTLASSIAEAHGTTVRQILEDNGELSRQMRESLSLVHSYGSNGYLNSPFAKTMNLVLFPSRFTAKVGMEAAKVLGRMHPAVQAATVSSIARGVAWHNSPAGQQWQKDNSELVGLIKYFTPLTEISNVAHFVDKGFHVGDLGEIGGLPVGVLSTILSGQGVNLGKLGSSQYFDPKTGQPVPNAIPTTTTARLQTGFASLLGSMFSYPGSTAGLQSKTKEIQGLVPMLKPASGSVDYRYSNGAQEGSPDAPAPEHGATPKITAAPVAQSTQLSTPIPTQPVKMTTPPAPIIKAKRSKTIPASQRLPGSSAF